MAEVVLDKLADSAMGNTGGRVRIDPAHFASYHNNQLIGYQPAATSMTAQRPSDAERSPAGVDTGSRQNNTSEDRMQGAGRRVQKMMKGVHGIKAPGSPVSFSHEPRAHPVKVKSEMQQLNDRASPPSF